MSCREPNDTVATALPARRNRLDATTTWAGAVQELTGVGRDDHCFLSVGDRCWYLADYHPGNYRRGLNQLIANLKCPPALVTGNRARLRHKQRAIAQLAQVLRDALPRVFVETATWVPIPPSAALDTPDFDDRLRDLLRIAFGGYDLDLRPLVLQKRSTPADHRGAKRLSYHTLLAQLCLNKLALTQCPLRARILLFDDLLTTGKHFKCCQQRLREALPQIPICGVFLARRVLSPRRHGWW